MLNELPPPDFSSHTTLDELQFAVLAEMHQTNFLGDYFERQDRCVMILGGWVKRTQEIIDSWKA